MILRLFLAVAAGLLIDVPEARLFTTPVLGALLFVTFLSIPCGGCVSTPASSPSSPCSTS